MLHYLNNINYQHFCYNQIKRRLFAVIFGGFHKVCLGLVCDKMQYEFLIRRLGGGAE